MKKFLVLIGLVLTGFVMTATAQEAKSYKEGQVTVLTYVKVKPGKFDEYMKWLATTGKAFREAEIKAGILLSYHVYSANPRTPREPDLILSSTYPNMAALDKDDDEDALAGKTMGNRATRNKAAEDREALREIQGSEIIRELVLK
ncbi:hypothetical protein [Solimicrobium silvestre]|uniref:Uncharacterized protein n=1 Tax=Solimicrobium silvestre TaxID=2099400 RepID=A0A2S9GU70_9BURK|nr:hypothetical protein [Solimicrobium silvestre]PRC91258.1 hypothetical protein S2091_4043 [Solimicrobium silvestre]